jgi:hypothetical protein
VLGDTDDLWKQRQLQQQMADDVNSIKWELYFRDLRDAEDRARKHQEWIDSAPTEWERMRRQSAYNAARQHMTGWPAFFWALVLITFPILFYLAVGLLVRLFFF